MNSVVSNLRQTKLAKVARFAIRGPVRNYGLFVSAVKGKKGIEVGGPSEVYGNWGVLPLYRHIDSLDNCVYSTTTVWADCGGAFHFHPSKKPGRNIIADATEMTVVADSSYEFLLSSHNLEHIANPIRALLEWKRILILGSPLVLIVPDYRCTFDHCRQPTTVEHMVADFRGGITEGDCTHIEEVLIHHDLARDPAAGTREEFEDRCRNNVVHRCIHHHVFDEQNVRGLLEIAGFRVAEVQLAQPCHICVLAYTVNAVPPAI